MPHGLSAGLAPGVSRVRAATQLLARDGARWAVEAALVVVALAGAAIVVDSIAAALRYRHVYPFWDMVAVQHTYLHLPARTFWLFRDNEHLPLFAMPLFALDNILLRGRGELLQGLLLAINGALALAFTWQAARAAGDRGALAAALAGLIGATMFWMQGWENLIWPKQVHMYLSMGGVGLAAGLLARPGPVGRGRVAGIAAALVLATFSFAYGVVGWVAVLCLAVARRWPLRPILALGGVFAACLVLYAALYNTSTFRYHGNPADSLLRPDVVARYVWEYVAALPVRLFEAGLPPDRADAAGRIATMLALPALLAALWPLRRRPPSEAETWAWLLILFTLGTGAMTALGRAARFGTGQALSPRYLVAEAPYWIGALILAVAAFGTHARARRACLAAVGLVITAALVVGQVRARTYLRTLYAEHVQAAMAMVDGGEDHALIASHLNPDVAAVLAVDADMRARRWSIYSWREPRWLGRPWHEIFRSAGQFACDGWVDGATPVDGTAGRLVAGWAWDRQRRAPATWVVLVDEQDVIRGLAHSGHARPDLPPLLYDAEALRAGWRGYAPASAPGPLRAYAVVDHERALCRLGGPLS